MAAPKLNCCFAPSCDSALVSRDSALVSPVPNCAVARVRVTSQLPDCASARVGVAADNCAEARVAAKQFPLRDYACARVGNFPLTTVPRLEL